MNVKSSFFNGFLEEKAYIKQLMGYEVKRHKDKVQQSLVWSDANLKGLE
jgi:hypothetical protein